MAERCVARLLCVVFVLALLSSFAWGARVVLYSGKEIVGDIVTENEESVIIRTSYGVVKFSRSEIRDIFRVPTESSVDSSQKRDRGQSEKQPSQLIAPSSAKEEIRMLFAQDRVQEGLSKAMAAIKSYPCSQEIVDLVSTELGRRGEPREAFRFRVALFLGCEEQCTEAFRGQLYERAWKRGIDLLNSPSAKLQNEATFWLQCAAILHGGEIATSPMLPHSVWVSTRKALFAKVVERQTLSPVEQVYVDNCTFLHVLSSDAEFTQNGVAQIQRFIQSLIDPRTGNDILKAIESSQDATARACLIRALAVKAFSTSVLSLGMGMTETLCESFPWLGLTVSEPPPNTAASSICSPATVKMLIRNIKCLPPEIVAASIQEGDRAAVRGALVCLASLGTNTSNLLTMKKMLTVAQALRQQGGFRGNNQTQALSRFIGNILFLSVALKATNFPFTAAEGVLPSQQEQQLGLTPKSITDVLCEIAKSSYRISPLTSSSLPQSSFPLVPVFAAYVSEKRKNEKVLSHEVIDTLRSLDSSLGKGTFLPSILISDVADECGIDDQLTTSIAITLSQMVAYAYNTSETLLWKMNFDNQLGRTLSSADFIYISQWMDDLSSRIGTRFPKQLAEYFTVKMNVKTELEMALSLRSITGRLFDFNKRIMSGAMNIADARALLQSLDELERQIREIKEKTQFDTGRSTCEMVRSQLAEVRSSGQQLVAELERQEEEQRRREQLMIAQMRNVFKADAFMVAKIVLRNYDITSSTDLKIYKDKLIYATRYILSSRSFSWSLYAWRFLSEMSDWDWEMLLGDALISNLDEDIAAIKRGTSMY